VDRHRIEQVIIVGDAFAKPMLRALDEASPAYDASSLLSIVSSGVMWSIEVKQGLLRHLPQVILLDSFGSSEAVGFGLSVMTAQGEVETARFQIGDNVKVFTPEGREVVPGSGEVGMIARGDPLPDGYFKDPAKTASTACGIRCPATTARSKSTAPSRCSAAAAAASTRPAKRCFRRRSKRCSNCIRTSRTLWWSVCPTRSGDSR
jgi:acyl-CoA synthetase (AMP-forming)/AMP-acid ligase II